MLRTAVLETLATVTLRRSLAGLLPLGGATARWLPRSSCSITTLLIGTAASPGLTLALPLPLLTLAVRLALLVALLVALLGRGVHILRTAPSGRLSPALLLLLLSTALPLRLGARVASRISLTWLRARILSRRAFLAFPAGLIRGGLLDRLLFATLILGVLLPRGFRAPPGRRSSSPAASAVAG